MLFRLFFLLIITMNLSAHEVLLKISLSPAGSFEAKTSKVRGDIQKNGKNYKSNGLWIKVEELKTGIDLRDDHLHKHLNYEKFPKIAFNNIEAVNGKGTGELVINEISKKVEFTYKELSATKIEASFKVKASNFQLKEARYLEIGVDDEVEILATMDI